MAGNFPEVLKIRDPGKPNPTKLNKKKKNPYLVTIVKHQKNKKISIVCREKTHYSQWNNT